MGAIVLNKRALAFYEGHMVRRAEISERMEALIEEADAEEEAMFEGLAELQGLDLDLDWELIDEHYEDFGVVLLRGHPAEPEDFEEPPREEPLHAAN